MNKQFKYAPLALAMAALFASPLAFAQPQGDRVSTSKESTDENFDYDSTSSSKSLAIDIEKDFNFDEDVYIDVDVDRGDLRTGENASYARAMIDDTQSNHHNVGINGSHGDDYDGPELVEGLGLRRYNSGAGHNNDATASNDALRDASGNIGLNMTAGDNNQQDNAAAIAVADAELTFGVADAQAHSYQDGELNETVNIGVSNNAGASGSALRDASGNIGVNISAGNNNQQKNNLAIATANGGVGLSMVTHDQESDHNLTSNSGTVVTTHSVSFSSRELDLSGTYSGISDQMGDLYSDVWLNDPGDTTVHPTDIDGPVAHADLDAAAQGAVDRPVWYDTNGDGIQDPDELSDGGALSFNEMGEIDLGGTSTGFTFTATDVYLPSTNTASLDTNALQGASGNIGVNIASGTGNQQVNSLAVTYSSGGAAPGGGNGDGE